MELPPGIFRVGFIFYVNVNVIFIVNRGVNVVMNLRVENKKITDLKPAPYNPRLDLQPGDPDYEKLKRSIQEFGLVEPIVFNERTGYVVGGHQRLKVLQDLGWSEVPVSVVDLDPEKEKALNVALNKIEGDWDNFKLKELLEELDTGAFDITITGFDEEEIEDLMISKKKPRSKKTISTRIKRPKKSRNRSPSLAMCGCLVAIGLCVVIRPTLMMSYGSWAANKPI